MTESADARAHFDEASRLLSEGRLEQAWSEYEKGNRLDPDSSEGNTVLAELARLYLERRRRGSGIRIVMLIVGIILAVIIALGLLLSGPA